MVYMQVILGLREGVRECRNQKDVCGNKKIYSGTTKVRAFETYLKENLVKCFYVTNEETEH